jgi:hypothetical protein
MWSTSTRGEEERKEELPKITDTVRNVRFIHMQINTPRTGNKTRASKVKEALMIIFATSKHIKLHPKEKGTGEIITNIDDLVTTEEVTNQYFFDKKLGGRKYLRGEGQVEYYSTKVRLETDIGLSQMKWNTSTKFIDALQAQNIYLKEFQDGKIMRTGNVGWLAGLNPANTSVGRTTRDLNRVLEVIEATAIIDTHTVSIRFPQTKKAFVTRAYKVMCNVEKIDEARNLLTVALASNEMGVGWEKVRLVLFNNDKQHTAMMIEEHNKLLHNTAVVAIKNIWSITEKHTTITEEEKNQLGMEKDDKADTIEDIWWSLANNYKHDVQGMVTRRGTLEILTSRKNLNDTVGFAKELVSNTISIVGEETFAMLTANFNRYTRKAKVQEAPMVLSGSGRVQLDTKQFTEEEFIKFAQKHGIPTGTEESEVVKELEADLTRPPKAMYYKPGREPVEHDPKKMREGAMKIWEKFSEKAKSNSNEQRKEDVNKQGSKSQSSRDTGNKETTSDEIARKGKMARLELTMSKMRESQESLEKSTTEFRTKLTRVQQTTENNMAAMSDMIAEMGKSITVQNKQLEAQAKIQVQQAEDIERIMKAIQAISDAVQVTPTATPDEEENENMQIDVAESNKMKRKQTSTELTTPVAAQHYESTIASTLKARSQFKGMNGAGRQ